MRLQIGPVPSVVALDLLGVHDVALGHTELLGEDYAGVAGLALSFRPFGRNDNVLQVGDLPFLRPGPLESLERHARDGFLPVRQVAALDVLRPDDLDDDEHLLGPLATPSTGSRTGSFGAPRRRQALPGAGTAEADRLDLDRYDDDRHDLDDLDRYRLASRPATA